MPFILNSDAVDEHERAEFVHEALGSTVVPMELSWPERRQGVEAHGSITDLGDLTVVTGRTTALRIERTLSLSRDATEPSVFINLHRTGSTLVLQNGRETVIDPGELVMYDSTSPYTLINRTGISGDFLRIPQSALAMPHDLIRGACAVNLSPGHPVTSLTNDYLRRLASDPLLVTAAGAELVAHPTIELVRALITIHVRGEEFATEPMAATLALRILEYVRTHLHDPDLSARQIAAAHYVSVRHLYAVLARSGISLSDWIRTRRLEATRQALAKAPATTTIAAIARRYGFSDMSAFSRAFRAEYGLSPREWRNR